VIKLLWNTAPGVLVSRYQHFRGVFCPQLQVELLEVP